MSATLTHLCLDMKLDEKVQRQTVSVFLAGLMGVLPALKAETTTESYREDTLEIAPINLTVAPTDSVEAASKLDIGINLFTFSPDTILSAEEESALLDDTSRAEQVVFVEKAAGAVREVEAYSIPIMLRDVLLDLEQFESVSLRPGSTDAHDLVVDGEILKSTGKHLILRMSVVDASGTDWLEYKYSAEASSKDYSVGSADPYASALEAFGNTLLHVIEKKRRHIGKLERLANVKYASSLAPETFERYLKERSNGTIRLRGRPSKDDASYTYAMDVRDEEIRILETYFGRLYSDIIQDVYGAYYEWRRNFGASVEAYENAMKAFRKEKTKLLLSRMFLADAARIIERKTDSRLVNLLMDSVRVDDDGTLYFDPTEAFKGEFPDLQSSLDEAHHLGKMVNQQSVYVAELFNSIERDEEPANLDLALANVPVELRGSLVEQFYALKNELGELYQREISHLNASSE